MTMAAAMVLTTVANAALLDRSVGCQPDPEVCDFYWEKRRSLDPQRVPPPGGVVEGARSVLNVFAHEWLHSPLECTPVRGDFEGAGGVWVVPGQAFWFEFDRAEPSTHCRIMSDRASD